MLGLGALLQLVLVVHYARQGWFNADALYYFVRRGPVPALDEGLFVPYGGHWQTTTIVVFTALLSVVGFSYVPFVLMGLAVHLGIAAMLVILFWRRGASPWTGVVAAWLLLFFGAGAEVFVSDAPVALTSALFLGVAAVLVLTPVETTGQHPTWRRPVIAAVLLLVAVTCSVTGVVAAVLVGCVTALDAGFRRAALIVLPSAAAFTVWFLTLGVDGGRVRTDAAGLLATPKFVWTGLQVASGNLVGIPGAGPVLVLLVLVAIVWPRPHDERLPGSPRWHGLWSLAFGGLMAAFAQMLLSAIANGPGEEGAAGAGRYQYIVAVLLLPGLVLAATRLWQVAATRGQPRTSSVAVSVLGGLLLLAATSGGLAAERAAGAFSAASGQQYRAWVLGTVAAVGDGERVLNTEVDNPFARGDDIVQYTRPELSRRLVGERVTMKDRAKAESRFFVGVGEEPRGHLDGTAELQVQRGLVAHGSRDVGCAGYTASQPGAELVMVVGSGGAQIVVTSASTKIVTVLSRGAESTPPRVWEVLPGRTYVASTAEGARLTMSFDAAGEYEVCPGG